MHGDCLMVKIYFIDSSTRITLYNLRKTHHVYDETINTSKWTKTKWGQTTNFWSDTDSVCLIVQALLIPNSSNHSLRSTTANIESLVIPFVKL